MKFEISDPDNILDKDFIDWLKIKIRDRFLMELNIEKLKRWDEFFNSNPVYKSIYKKRINTKDLLVAGILNLECTQANSSYILSINQNAYVPGLDRIKIATVCKLVNYGNLEISGYPIFTDILEYFADNIVEYVDRYVYNIL